MMSIGTEDNLNPHKHLTRIFTLLAQIVQYTLQICLPKADVYGAGDILNCGHRKNFLSQLADNF